METFSKIIRKLCDLPLIGGFVALIIGFAPALALLPLFSANRYIANFTIGLLIAAWCYFLSRKNIVNLALPVVPIPLWVGGILMSVFGAYGYVTDPMGGNTNTFTIENVESEKSRLQRSSNENIGIVREQLTRDSSKVVSPKPIKKARLLDDKQRAALDESAASDADTMTAAQYEQKLKESQEAIQKLEQLGQMFSGFGNSQQIKEEIHTAAAEEYENPEDIPLSAELTEADAEARARAYLRKQGSE